jgi:hypothetical protein
MYEWQNERAGSAKGLSDVSKLLVQTSRTSSMGLRERELSERLDVEGGSPHRGAGRGHRNEPFVIGVAGGTASGACLARLLLFLLRR